MSCQTKSGATGIPRITHVSERPALRPMPRKNIINLSRDMRFATMWYVGPVSLCTNAQSDSMSVKLLTEHGLEFVSLKGGCTGSSESKSHVAAQFMIYWLQAYASFISQRKGKFQTSTTNLDLMHTVRRFMFEFIEIVFWVFFFMQTHETQLHTLHPGCS